MISLFWKPTSPKMFCGNRGRKGLKVSGRKDDLVQWGLDEAGVDESVMVPSGVIKHGSRIYG